jgi:hypothetical protein
MRPLLSSSRTSLTRSYQCSCASGALCACCAQKNGLTPRFFFCSVTISKDQIGWKLDPSLRRSVCMCFRCSKLHPRRHHQNEGSCNWPGGLASAGHRFFVVIFEGHLRPYRSQGGLSRYGSDRVDARWTGDQTTPPSGSGASMDICLYALLDIIVWRTTDV